METALPSGLQLSALDAEFRCDPHSRLDVLRSSCPVFRDQSMGHYYLTRYRDVRQCLSDRTLSKNPDMAEAAAVAVKATKPPRIGNFNPDRDCDMLLMDAPEHSRVRTLFAAPFYKHVAKAGPIIEQIVESKLRALRTVRSFDVVGAYAAQIPVDLIGRLLGIDIAQMTQFAAWASALLKFLQPSRTRAETIQMHAGMRAFMNFLKRSMEERRGQPATDLISDLVTAQAQGAALSDGEIRVNLQGLLVGGSHSTASLIASAIWLLLSHPEQCAALRRDPELINAAVEEALRLVPPIDVTSRIAVRDFEIGGQNIREGEALLLSLLAANHDPDVFDDPHRFNIGREAPPHVAFGGGAHICIGLPLVRAQARIAITALLDCFPDMRLRDADFVPHWQPFPPFRSMSELPVLV